MYIIKHRNRPGLIFILATKPAHDYFWGQLVEPFLVLPEKVSGILITSVIGIYISIEVELQLIV